MTYFLIRVTVNMLAAAIVMNLVPGLRLIPNSSLPEPFATLYSYIIIGLLFGTLHSFVRPAILFLTGRLYIWSMGLLALVTDICIFLVLSYIAPAAWQVGESRLFSATLGAMLIGVIVMGLEMVLGFGAPRITEVRKSPFYWRWLGMLPTGRRNRLIESLRTQQIISTIQSYSIDILIGLSPLKGFRRGMQTIIYRLRPRLIEDSPAVKVRLMLQELGPTFTKFGQMAASRIEILPDTWRTELEQLQDDVQPFLYTEVDQIIRQELGKPCEETFASFDPNPLAAASTAQVHAATLPSGERVVVKVRRPNIEITVKGDLNIIQDVLNLIERRVAWSRRFGLSALFHEFAENVLTELDYTNESYNARLLRHKMQKFPFVQVPLIYDVYSTRKVLTQERVVGVKISDISALDAAGLNREELAINFFRALLQQVLFDGFFHADPHPGNVWVNSESGRIIFLDMGLMGQLSLEDRFAFGGLIWALNDRDTPSVTRVLMTICKPAKNCDPLALGRDIERLVNRNLLFADAPPSLVGMLNDLVAVIVQHGLQLRKEFVLAIKSIGQGESIMRILMGDKPMDYVLEVAYTQMRDLLSEQLTLENVLSHGGMPLIREIVGRLPSLQTATRTLFDNFQRGQLAFQVNVASMDQRMNVLQTAIELGIRRVVLSVLLVGLLVGSTLILLIPFEGKISEFEGLVIRLVAKSGFVIGALLIIIMLVYTLWQSIRKPKDA
ncbi:MAG: phage holin family protein [Caldilineaceae bacterium]|nr:phage holin family protein [Caldilineaceae bacterium]